MAEADWRSQRITARFQLLAPTLPTPLPILLWAPNGLNELPEVSFQFPFILICKQTMAFLTGPSWCQIKSCFPVREEKGSGWGAEHGFWHCFADGLYQVTVSFGVYVAGYPLTKNLNQPLLKNCF